MSDFVGWDFGSRILNEHAWGTCPHVHVGRKAQELIEKVLPGLKGIGEGHFLKVSVVRYYYDHLEAADAVNQYMDWLEETVKYVFDADFDPDYLNKNLPDPLAQVAREEIEVDALELKEFFPDPTIQSMTDKIIEGKECYSWRALMTAPEEIK